MQIRNKASGNLQTRFDKFRKEILASGKDPKQILLDLISSGKVSNTQLQNIISQARNSHLK